MVIKRIPAGIYAANCYIIMDESTKDAVVIDIGGDEDDIIKAVEALSANVKAILLTHGHLDHVDGVMGLKNVYDAPVYISEKDQELMEKEAYMFGSFEGKKADHDVNDGDIIKAGTITVKAIATPGHTPGGMCYLIGNDIFTGDTLFLRSVGRTDGPGGSHEVLINAIHTKLMKLDDNVKVWCGHGQGTTIGNERVLNPFL